MMTALVGIQTVMMTVSTGMLVFRLTKKGASYLNYKLINKNKGFKHYRAYTKGDK